MNGTIYPTLPDLNNDAARWRELVTLLQRKAYKPTITPEEIAAEMPDLREVYRALRTGAGAPAKHSQ